MAIITYIRDFFNSIRKVGDEFHFYGPVKIPKNHPYAGKKVHSWGKYKRSLRLSDGRVIRMIIQRYYLVETGKTFSLLPFVITPYQRHSNKVIEQAILKYFEEKSALEDLCKDPSPGYKTVRRWIGKFKGRLNETLDGVLGYLIRNRVEFKWPNAMQDTADKVRYLFDTIKTLINDPTSLREAGVLSYINIAVYQFNS